MAVHGAGLHHLHKRKRGAKKEEPYPARDRAKRFMDKAIYLGIAIGFLLTIPQAVKIWAEKDATGVSLITWIGYFIGGLFWLTYALLHEEKPLIYKYVLWLALYVVIIVGVVMYG